MGTTHDGVETLAGLEVLVTLPSGKRRKGIVSYPPDANAGGKYRVGYTASRNGRGEVRHGWFSGAEMLHRWDGESAES